jgi:hypothetical protein
MILSLSEAKIFRNQLWLWIIHVASGIFSYIHITFTAARPIPRLYYWVNYSALLSPAQILGMFCLSIRMYGSASSPINPRFKYTNSWNLLHRLFVFTKFYINSILTYYSRVFIDKLMVAKLLRKFPLLPRTRHYPLSLKQMNRIWIPLALLGISFLVYLKGTLDWLLRSYWLRGLRHEPSSLARTLGSWDQIPINVRMSVCVCVNLCVGNVLAMGWSPSKESYRLCIGSRNWKSGQVQQKAVEPQTD